MTLRRARSDAQFVGDGGAASAREFRDLVASRFGNRITGKTNPRLIATSLETVGDHFRRRDIDLHRDVVREAFDRLVVAGSLVVVDGTRLASDAQRCAGQLDRAAVEA